MAKLKIFLIISLVIVGVLLVWVVIWPMGGGEEKYSEVQRESLLERADGWVLQFDILNHEGDAMTYSTDIVVDATTFTVSFAVQSGGIYTYIHHINSSGLTDGKVFITIFKEGENAPFEQGTYYLKKRE